MAADDKTMNAAVWERPMFDAMYGGPTCAFCLAPVKVALACARCKIVYCGDTCRKANWEKNDHHSFCHFYTRKSNWMREELTWILRQQDQGLLRHAAWVCNFAAMTSTASPEDIEKIARGLAASGPRVSMLKERFPIPRIDYEKDAYSPGILLQLFYAKAFCRMPVVDTWAQCFMLQNGLVRRMGDILQNRTKLEKNNGRIDMLRVPFDKVTTTYIELSSLHDFWEDLTRSSDSDGKDVHIALFTTFFVTLIPSGDYENAIEDIIQILIGCTPEGGSFIVPAMHAKYHTKSSPMTYAAHFEHAWRPAMAAPKNKDLATYFEFIDSLVRGSTTPAGRRTLIDECIMDHSIAPMLESDPRCQQPYHAIVMNSTDFLLYNKNNEGVAVSGIKNEN